MGTAILPWLGRRLGLVLAVLVAGAGLMIATAIEASVSQQHSPSSLKNPGDPGGLAYPAELAVAFVRYWLIGWTLTFGAPWLFCRAGLAGSGTG